MNILDVRWFNEYIIRATNLISNVCSFAEYLFFSFQLFSQVFDFIIWVCVAILAKALSVRHPVFVLARSRHLLPTVTVVALVAHTFGVVDRLLVRASSHLSLLLNTILPYFNRLCGKLWLTKLSIIFALRPVVLLEKFTYDSLVLLQRFWLFLGLNTLLYGVYLCLRFLVLKCLCWVVLTKVKDRLFLFGKLFLREQILNLLTVALDSVKWGEYKPILQTYDENVLEVQTMLVNERMGCCIFHVRGRYLG